MTQSIDKFDKQRERISKLREKLSSMGLDGFIVPRGDEHQGEYVPDNAERLSWLTGFTGSAGLCVVLQDSAAIFIDGRYTLQVCDEVPNDLYTYRHLMKEPATRWISETLGSGKRLGFDPWLLTPSQVMRYRTATELAGGALISVDSNPIDEIWDDRPDASQAPITAYPLELAGVTSKEKRQQIAQSLTDNGQNAAVLSAPDSIAWLLNVRGGDLEHVPQPLSFAIIHNDATVQWFVDPAKPTAEIPAHLGNEVAMQAPDSIGNALDALGASRAKVRLNTDGDPYWISQQLMESGARVVFGPDPCALPKAKKTTQECAGIRNAHHRDGVALTKFLCWLDQAVTERTVMELEAVNKLETFRQETGLLKGLSFSTIAGAGPNGAIVHYRVSEESNRALEQDSLFLLDSGGQYLDGTTDVTRTIAIGNPSDEMRDNFSRVLKGHIALAQIKFPVGTTGTQLDPFARRPLWEAGLDYDHGTGHGVGCFLSVHEGPQRISKSPSAIALEPGMVISNEPGYYKTGSYGIRIENLVLVTQASMGESAERETLEFETLTLAPIDKRLINLDLMSIDEIQWLNDYHARVHTALCDHLTPDEQSWFKHATAPL